MPVIDTVGFVKASTREAAEKKIRAKAGKELHIHCNPQFDLKGLKLSGSWRCEVNYK